MPLLDLDKTTLKFWNVVAIVSGVIAAVGGICRFEMKMSKIESSIEANNVAIQNYCAVEILKINNRIDILEAKKLVYRLEFKSKKSEETFPKFTHLIKIHNKADRKKRRDREHPQFCMIVPKPVEFVKKKLVDIKKLTS